MPGVALVHAQGDITAAIGRNIRSGQRDAARRAGQRQCRAAAGARGSWRPSVTSAGKDTVIPDWVSAKPLALLKVTTSMAGTFAATLAGENAALSVGAAGVTVMGAMQALALVPAEDGAVVLAPPALKLTTAVSVLPAESVTTSVSVPAPLDGDIHLRTRRAGIDDHRAGLRPGIALQSWRRRPRSAAAGIESRRAADEPRGYFHRCNGIERGFHRLESIDHAGAAGAGGAGAFNVRV